MEDRAQGALARCLTRALALEEGQQDEDKETEESAARNFPPAEEADSARKSGLEARFFLFFCDFQ